MCPLVANEWVRPANKDDAAAVRTLLTLGGIETEFTPKEFVVCEVDGRIVGCAQARPVAEGGTELAALVVVRDFQRRGLGRGLMAMVLLGSRHPVYAIAPTPDLATQAGFEAIPTSLLPSSLRAKAERLGGYATRLRRVALPELPPEPGEPDFLEG